MEVSNQKEISEFIYTAILNKKEDLIQAYHASKSNIGYFYIDDLLPKELVAKCYKVFPHQSEMHCLKSLREYKYISAQMDKHDAFLEEVLYAFQDKKIVKLIGDICNIESLYADDSLYAGGLSLMTQDNYLHPHLDNSHDALRERWRVLNLLYYVTPNWTTSNGGHLEIWPNGPKKDPIVIESTYNRLVIMATHDTSWHSVNKVTVNNSRCCISNYYYSDDPLLDTDKFHITKFRGRPNDNFTNIILDLDAGLRSTIRKVFKKGLRKNPHVYKKKS